LKDRPSQVPHYGNKRYYIKSPPLYMSTRSRPLFSSPSDPSTKLRSFRHLLRAGRQLHTIRMSQPRFPGQLSLLTNTTYIDRRRHSGQPDRPNVPRRIPRQSSTSLRPRPSRDESPRSWSGEDTDRWNINQGDSGCFGDGEEVQYVLSHLLS